MCTYGVSEAEGRIETTQVQATVILQYWRAQFGRGGAFWSVLLCTGGCLVGCWPEPLFVSVYETCQCFFFFLFCCQPLTRIIYLPHRRSNILKYCDLWVIIGGLSGTREGEGEKKKRGHNRHITNSHGVFPYWAWTGNQNNHCYLHSAAIRGGGCLGSGNLASVDGGEG